MGQEHEEHIRETQWAGDVEEGQETRLGLGQAEGNKIKCQAGREQGEKVHHLYCH